MAQWLLQSLRTCRMQLRWHATPPKQDRAGGRLRSLMLAAVTSSIVLGIGITFLALGERHLLERQRWIVSDIGSEKASALQRHLDRALSSTFALAALIRQHGHINNFDILAADMLRTHEGLASLLLAPHGIIQQVYPIEKHGQALGLDLLTDPQRRAEAMATIASRKLTLAGPYTLLSGGTGIVGRLPIFIPDEASEDQFWGFIIALVHLPDLINASRLDRLVQSGYDYELSRLHADTRERHIFARSARDGLQFPMSFDIEVPNGQWTLSVAPRGGWQALSPRLTEGILVILSSLLVGCLIYALLRQPQKLHWQVELRTRELSEANRELGNEILERKRIDSALTKRTKQLEAIRDVTEEITRELDLTTLLTLITRRAMELVGAPASVTHLWDDATQVLVPRAWDGVDDWLGDIRVKIGEGVTGTAAQCRTGVLINDYPHWDGANPLFVERTAITALVAAPLLYRGYLLGVITLNNGDTGRSFTSEDHDILTLFAAQAAITIANAQLYERQELRATRLQSLTRLNQLISSSLDLDTVLHAISQAAAKLMDVPLVGIRVADAARQTLDLRTWSPNGLGDDHPHHTLSFGQGAAGWVAIHRQTLYIPG